MVLGTQVLPCRPAQSSFLQYVSPAVGEVSVHQTPQCCVARKSSPILPLSTWAPILYQVHLWERERRKEEKEKRERQEELWIGVG